ncbi:putative cyclin-dependent serine/threonine-protein kinase DDB_G0272797/DDB_G0274007 [Metopolophium dirhodum]|uniref:putative cyclin-dependent serine/threonine-protein kinase DDB_G0272797/DDB_G0274007 n=1 Tax=Metopolophium dirhodum TaxID=44670 RepID=UPI002990256C|nr:putative cyclin-dependent serine/threonine-protein kinase DDB_G0272797/DDB_G0274007 [Metopolophium dirhodum]
MAYKMFSVGLVMLAFVGMSLCQQQQQFNSDLPSQYLSSTMSQGSFQGSPAVVQQARTTFDDIESQSDKLSSSNLEQSRSYQDAVQQQNLAQSYQTAFGNTGVQYSTGTPNSYRGNQDSQQYYAPATQQSAEPKFITKESYSSSLPVVIPAATPAQFQPDYKQQFTTPTQAQQGIFGTDATHAQHEYRHHQDYRNQYFPSFAQAQVEYKQQVAALEQAQLEYKKQFAAISQTQQELKQQFAAPVKAQQELKQQFAVLAQAQNEYKQEFPALSRAQKEYKQQFAALNEAQHEFKQQFTAPTQDQQEYEQQFASLNQAQKEFNQQFVAPAQTPHVYNQRFTVPSQQVYRQQNTATATGPINYSYVVQYPATQIKSQTAAAVQPKFQYATNPLQFQTQQYYNAVPSGQVIVTEQPARVPKSATNQPSNGVFISTTPTPLKESAVYKSESTSTPRQ